MHPTVVFPVHLDAARAFAKTGSGQSYGNLSVCLSVCRPFLFCTDATEPEMRWQISMSLAYGARGILYFYWTQNVHKVTKDGPEWPGLVSGDG
jgi:hypothetical protein